MSTTRFLFAPRTATIRPRIRRKHRAALLCESLETRQLLSTSSIASTPAAAAAQTFHQVLPMAGGGTSGYSPQQIDSAYGISSLSIPSPSGSHAEPTIAIVDAYSDPNIKADVAAFDAQFGLAAPPSFTVDNLGATTTDAGWAVETALDVEWAHAIAPKANIVLVEAPNASLGSLLNAVSTAAGMTNVSVISMSWGTSEYYGEWNNMGVFNTPSGHTNETFVAASGDSGAWSGPSFPAVSPNVLAVGGSTLTLGSSNSYGSETGWTYSTGGFSGLDNGFRYGLSAGSYQIETLTSAGLNYGLRTTPDVSFNADPNTGFAVYDSVPYYGSSGWFDVGGTSAAAPAWAGLVALTDQGLAAAGKSPLSTTQLLTDLYSLPSSNFHDITSGFNGYSAGSGYDLVTGLGTPKANLLVPALLAANGVTKSPTPVKAAAATQQATSSAVSNNAVVASSSPTVSATAVGTFTVTGSGSSVAIAALPSQSLTTTITTGATGQASSAPISVPSTSTSLGSAVGFGQGTSAPSALVISSSRDIEEAPGLSIDAIGGEVEAATPESPVPQSPAPDAPMPQPSPIPVPEPGGLPVIPTSASFSVWVDPRDAMIMGIHAIRVESDGGREEESSRTPAADDVRTGPLAGMTAAGLIATLGARVVLGPRPRRRQLSVRVRAVGH